MERTLSNVNEKCVSAWALLLPPHARNSKAYRMHKYVNPIYDGFDDAQYGQQAVQNFLKTLVKTFASRLPSKCN